MLDFSAEAEEYTPQQALRDSAQRLQVPPEDLATVISYETAGSFDPWQKGPVTKWGEHRGLIQWGEPQRQRYGVTQDMPFQSQVQAAEQYLLDRGFRPGEMGLEDLYSTINAGAPGRMGASDRPGFNVARHVQEMEAHRPKAMAFLSQDQAQAQGLDFSAEAEPVGPAAATAPQPGGLDFSDQAEPLDFSSQAEPLDAGSGGSQLERGVGGDGPIPAAPAGEVAVPGQSPPAVAENEPGYFDFIKRSMLEYRTRNVMVNVLAGNMDIPTASARFAELVKEQEAIPERQSYVEGAKAHAKKVAGQAPEYEGVTGALRFAFDYPTYVAEAIGESSIQMLEGMGVGLAGAGIGSAAGPIGTAAGFATGLGASSGVTEGIGKYMEVLSEAGVDVTNEESLQGAFANAELLEKAKSKAKAKGLTVAGFDAITSFLGIRGAGKHLAEGFGKVVGSQSLKKSQAREAVEEGAATLFLIEAPGGMAGDRRNGCRRPRR